ncbi:MAG: ATP-binding protein, partial [Myxococcales bacterium]
QGFAGLRLTGNTYWVERNDWQGFVDYESRVSRTFENHHIIGLCSYCLERCQPHDILDVVANHNFAITRRDGAWHVLESASLSQAKSELRRANEELERRVLERTAELERAVRARDEFLSVASHELKTPITSLQLFVQGMLRARERGTLTEETISQRLKRVEEQCRRLDKLVNNLLDVTRAEVRGPALQKEPLDIAELVTDAVDRFAEEFARARCRVRLDAQEPVTGEFDRMRLEQAISNLLQNVVRYAPGTAVEVSVTEQAGEAVVRVRDEGPGIAPADQERIFDRFVQAENRNFSGGFGLGLWIVKQVAQAHGGQVILSSRLGAGAEFTLRLPRG